MDDLHEQIRVALWQLVPEEVPGLERQSLRGHTRLLDDVRQIEEDPSRVRRVVENGTQQVTATAADISDPAEAREVV